MSDQKDQNQQRPPITTNDVRRRGELALQSFRSHESLAAQRLQANTDWSAGAGSQSRAG